MGRQELKTCELHYNSQLRPLISKVEQLLYCVVIRCFVPKYVFFLSIIHLVMRISILEQAQIPSRYVKRPKSLSVGLYRVYYKIPQNFGRCHLAYCCLTIKMFSSTQYTPNNATVPIQYRYYGVTNFPIMNILKGLFIA